MRPKVYASPFTPYESAVFLSPDYAPTKRFTHEKPLLLTKPRTEKAKARAMATPKKAAPPKPAAVVSSSKAESKIEPPEIRCRYVRKLFYVLRSFEKIGKCVGVNNVTAWRWYSGVEEVPPEAATVVAKTLRGLESRTKSDALALKLPVSFDRAVSKLILYLVEHMGATCTAERLEVSKENVLAWATRKKKLGPESPVLPKMIALLDSLGQIEIARRKGQVAEFF